MYKPQQFLLTGIYLNEYIPFTAKMFDISFVSGRLFIILALFVSCPLIPIKCKRSTEFKLCLH